MKKVMCLVLSLIMIMSLAVVPVSADNTTGSVIVTPVSAGVTPSYHVTADLVRESTTITNRNEMPLAASNGTILKLPTVAGDYTVNSRSVGVYVYDDATAPSNLTPWEGFKLKADTAQVVGNIRPSYGEIGANDAGISLSQHQLFLEKDLRADSVRFMLPEQGTAEDAGIILFSCSNSGWYQITDANRPTALRIINGGAKSIDLSDPVNGTNWVSFIPEDTIRSGKWYRAERLLDTRIDDGVGSKDNNQLAAIGTKDGVAWSTTTENWQRFIIYEEHKNGESIVGDSGWVLTGRMSKTQGVPAGSGFETTPFSNTAFTAFNYPAGSYVYLDDFKAWAVDTPSGDETVEFNVEREKWLAFPTENNSLYKENKAVGVKSYSGTAEQGESPTAYTTDKGLDTKYIYMQESFMIPEINSTEIGLLDLTGKEGLYTNNTDYGAGYTEYYNNVSGVVRIKNGVLTVKEWDGITDFSGNKGYYTTDASLKDGSAFSLTLIPGEWYKATVKIDQSMYAGKMVNDASIIKIKDSDDNAIEATPADMTKATVIIEDSQGNVYETEEFNWKSPSNYLVWAYYGCLVFADGRRLKVSTDAFNYKINLDDIKVILSDGTIDAEDAYPIFMEGFDDEVTGATYDTVATHNANFQNSLAMIEEEFVSPSGFSIVLDREINSTNIENAVKLYKDDVDVTGDHVTGITYNAETKTIELGISALFPSTEYKIVIDRCDLTDIEADIFASIPGDGKTAEYVFTTSAANKSTLVFTPSFVIENKPITDVASLSDYAGHRIYAPYEGLGVEMATIKNYNNYDTAYVAIAAIYDEAGKMEDMISESGVVPANETINVTFGFDPATQKNGYLTITGKTTVIESFIWNTWRLRNLYGETYVYPYAQ